MTNYGITLIIEGREVALPVLPANLKITSPGKNETTTVLELGEALLLRPRGLRTVAWDSFFPARAAPYVTGRVTPPIEIVKAIQAARDALSPLRLLITGADLDVNVRMGIESFDYEERAGEAGDLYSSIKLCEWKDLSPKRLILTENPGTEATAKLQEPERPGAPPAAAEKTYTVKKGDCLWNIARKFYGKGSDYKKIYDANKAVIGKNPNLIYPGQVLKIP